MTTMIKQCERTKMLIMALIMFVAIMALTGCKQKKKNTTPTSVVVVLGAHNNARALNLANGSFRDHVSGAIESEGSLAVISNDGNPEIVSAQSYKVGDQYKGNAGLLKEMAGQETDKALEAMQNVRADDPEIDTLESLRLGVRVLASAPQEYQKELVVIDTGLSTTGLVDFRNYLINADPDAVADMLAEKKAIPDFTGITVYWRQMADVDEPQQQLSPAQKENLWAIWAAIITRGGGTIISTEVVPNPGKIGGALPKVSEVELPSETAVKFDPIGNNDYEEPQFLSEEQVRFEPDSDQYVNPEDAEGVIKPIATYMLAHKGFKMLLVGCTAGDENNSFSEQLSKRRAVAVKNTLISMGVSDDSITCLGLGSSDPWHIPNVGTEGPIASSNRKVVLMDANSDTARDLITKAGQ